MNDFQVGDYVVCNRGNKNTIFQIVDKDNRWYTIKSVCSLELGNYGKKFRPYTRGVSSYDLIKIDLSMLQNHITLVEKFIESSLT